MSSSYRFSRGDKVRIISGKHKGASGTVDAKVFQRSADLLDEHTPSYHVVLDSELVVTVNMKQVDD
jgi:ribosomal protein L24